MTSVEQRIREIALGGVSFPVRAAVRDAAADGAGYLVDLEVLDRHMEPTGEMMETVPMQSLWLGGGGLGVYAPPEIGSVVLVVFVDGDRESPVVVGLGGDAQVPQAAVPAGALAVHDGRGASIWVRGDGTIALVGAGRALVHADNDRVRIATAVATLLQVLEEIVDQVIAMQTVGSPSLHTVEPGSQAALASAKARLSEVLR